MPPHIVGPAAHLRHRLLAGKPAQEKRRLAVSRADSMRRQRRSRSTAYRPRLVPRSPARTSLPSAMNIVLLWLVTARTPGSARKDMVRSATRLPISEPRSRRRDGAPSDAMWHPCPVDGQPARRSGFRTVRTGRSHRQSRLTPGCARSGIGISSLSAHTKASARSGERPGRRQVPLQLMPASSSSSAFAEAAPPRSPYL
jgi:hypothetical protein